MCPRIWSTRSAYVKTAEHKRLKTILREVSQLTLALVQGHVKHRQRRQGRPLNIGPILAQTIRHFFPDFQGVDRRHQGPT